MHITCPHCSATYEVGPVIKNALLVCFRCHAEFNVDETPIEAKIDHPTAVDQEKMLPLFGHVEKSPQERSEAEHSDEPHSEESASIEDVREPESESESEEAQTETNSEESGKEIVDIELTEFEEEKPPVTEPVDEPVIEPVEAVAEKLSESEVEAPEKIEEEATTTDDDVLTAEAELQKTAPPPARSRAAIWPWLIAILLIIGGSGFWYKQDVWLDHPWVRSVLINMHLPVQVRDKDWHIIPDSVHGQWLTRDDESRVLVIEGRVANRLYSEVSPPQIQVHFFDDSGLDQVLGETTLAITEPPGIEQIKHAPFESPDIDRVPVEAQGERGFFLVLDALPERTADFTLTAVVRKK